MRDREGGGDFASSAPVACVDELAANDGSACSIPPNLHDIFPHFTALPSPNDYQALGSDRWPPNNEPRDLQFAIDREGNVLVPMDWSKILLQPSGDSLPVARLVRGKISVDAFDGGKREPLLLPDSAFLGAYTDKGAKLPPILDAQLGRDGGRDALVLLGRSTAGEGCCGSPAGVRCIWRVWAWTRTAIHAPSMRTAIDAPPTRTATHAPPTRTAVTAGAGYGRASVARRLGNGASTRTPRRGVPATTANVVTASSTSARGWSEVSGR